MTNDARADLIAAADTSFAAMMGAARALPVLAPAASGEWGAFECLAHIDGWHLSAASRLRQIAEDKVVTSPEDADALNERFIAERRHLSPEQLLTGLAASFRELKEAALDLPAAEFWRGGAGREDSLAYFIFNANGPDHYREHEKDFAGATS